MYLQIQIEPSDRSKFRFLWRDCHTNEIPDVYEFSRVVFGEKSAPFEAQYVAQENARRHKTEYPRAEETVMEATYMDDSLDSASSSAEGIEFYLQLMKLWKEASMKACKWISNCSEVLGVIPEECRKSKLQISNPNQMVNTLGISWDSVSDVMKVSSTKKNSDKLTKRNVLSKVSSVFDPLGFVSPYVVVAKIILQEIWARG
jgi:hypothetical protein